MIFQFDRTGLEICSWKRESNFIVARRIGLVEMDAIYKREALRNCTFQRGLHEEQVLARWCFFFSSLRQGSLLNARLCMRYFETEVVWESVKWVRHGLPASALNRICAFSFASETSWKQSNIAAPASIHPSVCRCVGLSKFLLDVLSIHLPGVYALCDSCDSSAFEKS